MVTYIRRENNSWRRLFKLADMERLTLLANIDWLQMIQSHLNTLLLRWWRRRGLAAHTHL